MALQANQELLHFLLVPLMTQSHIIPLTDFAILLAQRGVKVTLVTTPLNAIRSEASIRRAQKLNLNIQLIPIRFPTQEAGLPDGCESMDSLSLELTLVKQFYLASRMYLQQPLEKLVRQLDPKPNCIVTTHGVPWTSEVARVIEIPRYVFHTTSCFNRSCSRIIERTKVHESVSTDWESFLVPDIPHKVEFTRSQLPGNWARKDSNDSNEVLNQIEGADCPPRGYLVNSCEELEPSYVENCKACMNNLWCIGPVSLRSKDVSDDGGNKASHDVYDCLNWLDSKEPKSVIYACFGSLCNISPPQMIELGLGLESSNHPFIWIISARHCSETVKDWFEEEKFEERVKGRGLIVRGWAPQVQILSHSSVGGFLTHCGWNSTQEGVCAGVPMITWPMFADQFFNEQFIVSVLRIGVSIGHEVGLENGLVKSEKIKEAIDNILMDEEEGKQRRKRARELGDMAKKAMEEGGSSYTNISLLIEDVRQQMNNHA